MKSDNFYTGLTPSNTLKTSKVNKIEVSFVILLMLYVYIASTIYYIYIYKDGDIYFMNKYRLWADSHTYRFYAENTTLTISSLISLSKNYLGPVLIYQFFNFKEYLIYFFNILLILSSIFVLFRNFRTNAVLISSLILFNPLTIISIFFINKEIPIMFSIICFCVFIFRNNYKYLIFSIIFSFFWRWQIPVIMIIYVSTVFVYKKKLKKSTAIQVLFIFSLILNFIYPLIPADTVSSFEVGVDVSNTTKTLLSLQNQNLFIIVLPLKLFMNLFGNPFFNWSYFYKLNDDQNLYDLFIVASEYYNLAMFIPLLGIFRRKFNSKLLIFLGIFAIVFCITPFIQMRYFYPILPAIYILLFYSKQYVKKPKVNNAGILL